VVREGLVELRQAAAANRSEAFFATTFRLMQEQLGERLDSRLRITEAVVDERLEPLGLDATLLANTRDLFQPLRSGPLRPIQQPGELVALLRKSRRRCSSSRPSPPMRIDAHPPELPGPRF